MASTARRLETFEVTPSGVLELPVRVPQGPANRRSTPRVAASFIVRPLDGGESFEGVDISFGGLTCTAAEPIWPGNLLDVDLILPGERQPVAARARVVELVSFCGRIAMRMRFESMTAGRRKRIAAWMARRGSA